MFKVEKVPIPADIERPRNRWPFGDCEVGDSFWVPASRVNSISGGIRFQRKRWGRRFVSRREGDGYRIYRLAWPGGAATLDGIVPHDKRVRGV